MNGMVDLGLEGLTRKIGMGSGLLYSVSWFLAGIIFLVCAGLSFQVGSMISPFDSSAKLGAQIFSFLGMYLIVMAILTFLVSGVLCMASINFGRGALESKHILWVIIVYSIFLFISLIFLLLIANSVNEVISLASSLSYSSARYVGLLPIWAPISSIIGTVLLVVGAILYKSPASRIAAGILAFVGVLMISIGILSFNNAIASLARTAGMDAGSMMSALPYLPSLIGLIAMMILSIGALLYSFLGARYKSIIFMIFVAGAFMFGIAWIMDGISGFSVNSAISTAASSYHYYSYMDPQAKSLMDTVGLLGTLFLITGITEIFAGILLFIASSVGIAVIVGQPQDRESKSGGLSGSYSERSKHEHKAGEDWDEL